MKMIHVLGGRYKKSLFILQHFFLLLIVHLRFPLWRFEAARASWFRCACLDSHWLKLISSSTIGLPRFSKKRDRTNCVNYCENAPREESQGAPPLAGTRIAPGTPTQAKAPGTPPPVRGSLPRTPSSKTRLYTRSRPTRSGKARPTIAISPIVGVVVGLAAAVGAEVEETPEEEANEMGPNP